MNEGAGSSRTKIAFGGLQKAVPAMGQGMRVPRVGAGLAAGQTENDRSRAPTASGSSLLGGDEDDEEVLKEKPSSSVSKARSKDGSKTSSSASSLQARAFGTGGAAPISRLERERQQAALSLDASIFDYDGVYDSMKGGEREAMQKREEEKRKRDPKYMAASLAASEQRKVDRQRAEAKKIQREREQEGDQFADSEAFVTDAYKRQMEEMREAEKDERSKEEEDRKQNRGVAGFYKDLLAEQEKAHRAAVAATLTAKSTAKQDSPSQAEESEEKRKRARIEEARQKGLDVRVNDENDVVDERSLLTAGLNTFSKRIRHGPHDHEGGADARTNTADRDGRLRREHGGGERDGAREAREAREAQRRRQSKMIEEQMLAVQQQREEEERAQEEERKKALLGARRKDAERIADARQRAIERRRRRQEEEAAAAAGAATESKETGQ